MTHSTIEPIKVLVCGGRRYENRRQINTVLMKIHTERGIALVIHGAASGADTLAGMWARHNHIPVCEFPANWSQRGRQAGPERNGHMLQFGKPDLVVAFPGGSGTANMIAQAERAGVDVLKVEP